MSGLGNDPEVQKRYILSMISYTYNANIEMKKIVDIYRKMNNNDFKMDIMAHLINDTAGNMDMKKSSYSYIMVDSEAGDEVDNSDMIEKLEEEIKMREEEALRIDKDLSNVKVRNNAFNKEVKKIKDYINVMKEDSIDKKVFDLESQIKEIQDDIDLLSNLT